MTKNDAISSDHDHEIGKRVAQGIDHAHFYRKRSRAAPLAIQK
jgi:hypothetical protein